MTTRGGQAGVLEVREVSSGYGGVSVLRGVTLTVPPGSITAVLGANGAGKTTLLRTVSGLLRPTAGRIVFDGHDLSRVAVERRAQAGLVCVPEGGGVIAELTVEENLRLGGLWRRDVDTGAVYELFEELGHRRRHLGHQLSGGERQLVAIGRALLARPTMLLLDEPSLGLAPRVVARLLEVLVDLRSRTGCGLLLAEQNARAALAVADQVVTLSLGRVTADQGHRHG